MSVETTTRAIAMEEQVDDRSAAIPTPRRRRVSAGNVMFAIWGVIGLAFLFFPVIVIIVFSFNQGRQMQVFSEFGLGAYTAGLSNPTIVSSIIVSLIAAFGTAVLSGILGSLAGLGLGRSKAGWVGPVMILLAFVMVTPEIVNGVSLLPWFVTLGHDWGISAFDNGQLRLILGHSLFSSAIVTFVVRGRVSALSVDLNEAAADLGATPVRAFLDVTFPLIRPAVIAGSLLGFTMSLDNTVLSSFISVAGTTPWPVYVWASLRSTLRPEIAAMSTIMLLLTLLLLAIVVLVLVRAGRRTGQKTSVVSDMIAG